MSKTILVLGAGTGGIITAKELSKKVGCNAKILVFEKEEKNVLKFVESFENIIKVTFSSSPAFVNRVA